MKVRRSPNGRLLTPLKSLFGLFFGLAALGLPGARADDSTTHHEVHVRTGMISGSYSGPVSGTLPSSQLLDGEYELFTGPRSATTFRALIAYDLAKGRVGYGYAGMGRSYYLWGNGVNIESSDNKEASFTSIPKRRYYVGWDLGMSYVVVKEFGTVLTAHSEAIDVGAHLGFIWQVSKSIGIDLHGGYTKGFGFSSVAVSTTTTRIFAGVVIGF